jgi:hypothetical protein
LTRVEARPGVGGPRCTFNDHLGDDFNMKRADQNRSDTQKPATQSAPTTRAVDLSAAELDILGDALMVYLEKLGKLRSEMGAMRLFSGDIDRTRDSALALFKRLNHIEGE